MERTYKKIEIVGISETSFGEATQNAVAKACQSLRHVDWFEVTEMRGLVEKDKVKEFDFDSEECLRQFLNKRAKKSKSKAFLFDYRLKNR